MKNEYTIANKIWSQLYIPVPGESWAVVYDNTTLIESDTVTHYLYDRYGDFYCSRMWTKWQTYNELHAADFARALSAWNAEYNPLDNYNGKETRVNLDNYGAETNERETDPQHNKITNAALAGTESATYTTTDTSETERLEEKTKNTGGTETTDDLHETKTKTRESSTLTIDGTTYTAHDVHGEIYTRAGNLGVTTSQQMITSETEMRLNPVQKNYLDRFIYMFASYVGGAWDE
jgi:hypothetical protein